MKTITEKIREIRKQIPGWTLSNELEFLKGEMNGGEWDLASLDFTDLLKIFEPHDVVLAYGEWDLLEEIPIDEACSYYGTDELLEEIGDAVMDHMEASGLVVVPDDDELVSNAEPYELIKAACNKAERGVKTKEDLQRIVSQIIEDNWDGKCTR